MAEAVAAGITEAGKEAEVVYVSDVNVADLTAEKAFALGCPAMGAEVLEEGEFEPPGITIASLKTALLGCVRPDISV